MRYVNSAYTYSPQDSNVISVDNGDSVYHFRMWQHGLKHSHANLMRPFFCRSPRGSVDLNCAVAERRQIVDCSSLFGCGGLDCGSCGWRVSWTLAHEAVE